MKEKIQPVTIHQFATKVSDLSISEEEARITFNIISKKPLNSLRTNIDYLPTLRSKLFSGKMKDPCKVFGLVGYMYYWMLIEAPMNLMPLLISHPDFSKLATQRLEGLKLHPDPKYREEEIIRLTQNRPSRYDEIFNLGATVGRSF